MDRALSWPARVGYAPLSAFVEPSHVIKTGPHLKQAREALGWTPVDLARALRLAGGDKQGEKRVLEMESGKRDISGPVTVAVESFLRGFLPEGFRPEGGAGADPQA